MLLDLLQIIATYVTLYGPWLTLYSPLLGNTTSLPREGPDLLYCGGPNFYALDFREEVISEIGLPVCSAFWEIR